MDKLKLVLDSNEYIFYFGNKSNEILKLLDFQELKIFLNDLIIQEVIRNINKENAAKFFNILKNPRFNVIMEQMTQNFIEKYRKMSLRKGDVLIAALCETIGADYLISENRHFLKKKIFDEFEVLSLKEFLRKIEF